MRAGLLVAGAGVDGCHVCGGVVGERVGRPAGGLRGLAEAVECPRLAIPVADLAEERQRPAVVVGGLTGSVETGVHIAEADERPRFAAPVAGLPVEVQRHPVVFGGWPVPAQPGLDVAEIRERLRLAGPVALLPEQRQCLFVVPGRGVVAAQPFLDGAEVVKHAGLADAVTGLLVERQRLPVVAARRTVAAQPRLGGAEVAQRTRLPDVVADLPEQHQGLLQQVGGLLVPAESQVDGAKAVQRLGFAGLVAGQPGGVAGVAVERQGVGVVAAEEVAEQRRREQHRVRRPAVPGRVAGRRDQRGPFGVQPGQGGVPVGERRDRCRGHVEPWPAVRLGRVQHIHRDHGDARVIVEQPADRRVPLGRGVLGRGQAGGVRAEQVVHAVPGGPRRMDQVGAGKRGEQDADLTQARAGQRGRCVGVEIRSGMQRREPEGAAGAVREVPDRPGEDGGDRGPGVAAGVEQIQPPLLVGQLVDQVGQRRGALRGGQLGGHPQCQWQPGALLREPAGRLRLRLDPPADQLPKQREGVGNRQHVQLQPPCAVHGHQPGQAVAAGHDHDCGGRAG